MIRLHQKTKKQRLFIYEKQNKLILILNYFSLTDKMFRIKNLRVVLHVFFFYWKDKGIPPFKCRVLADLVRNNPFGIWNNWNRIQLVHLFVYFLGGYWKFLRLQEEYITRPSDSWYILFIVEEISNSLLESKQMLDLIVKYTWAQ